MSLKSHISLIYSIIILIASMMQFHHHGCDGNIYVHLTTIEDLAIGSNGLHMNECDHSASHHHNNECGVNDSCAMHITEYKIVDSDTQTDVECCDLLFEFAQVFDLKIIQHSCKTIYCAEEIGVINLCPLLSLAMRAPPICV